MKCGGCTLCCELLEVPWMNSPKNILCEQCEKSKGCKIFTTIDKRCKDFQCSYNQMDKVHIDLRPDNCKVIFEKISDEVFHGTLHPDYEIKDVVQQQINFFLKDGYSVVLMSSKFKKPKVYIAEKHTMNSIYEIVKKRLIKNERSNLHNRPNSNN